MRDRRRQLRLGARQHDLLGAVVVGDGEIVGGSDLLRLIGGTATEHGDHAAVAGLLPSLIHQPPAQRHQLEAGALVQRARRDQRGQLAQRVAGHVVPVRATQGVPSGEAGAEDRGLGEVGPVGGADERILADDLDRSFEQLRSRPLHVVAHLGGLAPLPGEQDRGGRAHPVQPTPHEVAGYSVALDSPRSGGGTKPGLERHRTQGGARTEAGGR